MGGALPAAPLCPRAVLDVAAASPPVIDAERVRGAGGHRERGGRAAAAEGQGGLVPAAADVGRSGEGGVRCPYDIDGCLYFRCIIVALLCLFCFDVLFFWMMMYVAVYKMCFFMMMNLNDLLTMSSSSMCAATPVPSGLLLLAL